MTLSTANKEIHQHNNNKDDVTQKQLQDVMEAMMKVDPCIMHNIEKLAETACNGK